MEQALEQASGILSELLTSDRFYVYRTVLTGLGAACLLKITLKTLWTLAGGFREYFLAPWGLSRINLTKYGSWAIVTGASEGIGRGYALELAKQGLNVMIMSRSTDKLKKVADEITNTYNREVRYLAVDFTKGQSVYEDIQAEISDLDVAILVNNVGIGVACPELTADIDEQHHRNMIEVNCQTMVQMTHLVLPKMVDKKRGIIVTISSLAGQGLMPLVNVYSATKVFIRYFSDALRYEYKPHGIVVQTVYPGLVVTPMSSKIIEHPNLWAPSSKRYAEAAVATIGVQNDTFGYFFHAVQYFIFYLMNERVRTWVLYKISFEVAKALKKRKSTTEK